MKDFWTQTVATAVALVTTITLGGCGEAPTESRPADLVVDIKLEVRPEDWLMYVSLSSIYGSASVRRSSSYPASSWWTRSSAGGPGGPTRPASGASGTPRWPSMSPSSD